MNRTLSLPVQELIRASERVLLFAAKHNGLPEDGFEAVLRLIDRKRLKAGTRAPSLPFARPAIHRICGHFLIIRLSAQIEACSARSTSPGMPSQDTHENIS